MRDRRNRAIPKPQVPGQMFAVSQVGPSEFARGRVIHRGQFEPFDITGIVYNPTSTQTLVSFQIPAGYIGALKYIGIFYSQPMIPMTEAVGWRIVVNGSQLPHFLNQIDGLTYTTFGDITNPLTIETVYIQAGQTVAIELVPRSDFEDQVTIIGRIGGRLLVPEEE